MTVAYSRPVIAAPAVEEVLTALRAHGLRVSSARRLVVEALFAAGGPVSALDIAGGLGGRLTCVDAASVYANLETFEQLGLVTHVHVGHGPGLYALADRVARHYVCCEHCGALRALPASVLAGVRSAIREATGYQARFTHFPIMGLCPGCQAESSPHA